MTMQAPSPLAEESAENTRIKDAVNWWTFSILVVGLLMPFLSGLVIWAFLKVYPSSNAAYAAAISHLNPFDWSVKMLRAGSFSLSWGSLSWWPFAVYALVTRRLYRTMLKQGITHPSIPILGGLIGLVAIAVLMWSDAFFSPLELTASTITLFGGLWIQGPGAGVGLLVGWLIVKFGSPNLTP